MDSTADREWRTYVEPLLRLGERTAGFVADPRNAQSRHEMYRHLFSQIAAAYFGRVVADAEHPDFWPYVNGAFNMLGPNPDYIYYLTPVDGTGVYRITGFRGTVRAVDLRGIDDWAETLTTLSHRWLSGLRDKGFVNRVTVRDDAFAGYVEWMRLML